MNTLDNMVSCAHDMHAIITVAHVHHMYDGIYISIIRQQIQDTPLHKAAAYGHLETVKLLVQKRASLKRKNNVSCFTCMHAVTINYINANVYCVLLDCYKEVHVIASDPI